MLQAIAVRMEWKRDAVLKHSIVEDYTTREI